MGAQGDAERSLGLSISMNCDRTVVDISKCQVGFITFLVAPLYRALLAFAPSVRPLVDKLEANLKHFENA